MPTSVSTTVLPNRSCDAARPLRIAVVGAGASGILAGIKLPQAVQHLELAIYDKNAELGGTWFENKYPGCACDIPAHCYQLSFESHMEWSQFYASASEILQYWKRVADKYGVRKYLKLRHKVQQARWSEEDGRWHLEIEDLEKQCIVKDEVDILFQCLGSLNTWKWPEIPGLHEFQGKLLHTAAWDDDFDYKNKSVAVIGAGSSGIQVTPSLQPHVSRLDQYIRSKTWISHQFSDTQVVERIGEAGGNFSFTEAEIAGWKAEPATYLKYRRALEKDLQSHHAITMKGSANAEAREGIEELMRSRMASVPGLEAKLMPDFPPLCKRLTPGPGFLEALTQPNVHTIADRIERIDATSIIDCTGTKRPVDAIVCATGFDASYTARFSTIGRQGIDLRDHWANSPRSYLSLATDGFPNLFFALGPHSAVGTGNLLMLLEREVEYVASAAAKLQREALKCLVPRPQAVDAFEDYCHNYFPRTVFSETCSSWYKGGKNVDEVLALWPGSSLHAVQVLKNPRWEDWDYVPLQGAHGWLGDGWSVMDREEGHDMAYYITEDGGTLGEPVGKPMVERKSPTNGHV